MALQINLSNNKWGVPLPEAYVRFQKQPFIDGGTGTVKMQLEVYANAAAALVGKGALPGISFAEVVLPFDRAVDVYNVTITRAYDIIKNDAVKWPALVGAIDA